MVGRPVVVVVVVVVLPVSVFVFAFDAVVVVVAVVVASGSRRFDEPVWSRSEPVVPDASSRSAAILSSHASLE